MRLYLVMLVFVAITSGCGTYSYWMKPGASRDDFYRDTKECAVESTHGDSMKKELYRVCMLLRGYQRIEVPETEAPPANAWRPIVD
jgi:hypothetical protein